METIKIIDLYNNKVLGSFQTEDVIYWVSFLKSHFIMLDNIIEDFQTCSKSFYIINQYDGERSIKVEVK